MKKILALVECLLVEWAAWAAAWECNHSYSKQNSKRAVFTALFLCLS
jgi:hypothetical protein